MASPAVSRRCSARTPGGHPCRAWAMNGSEPPKCAAHTGKLGPPEKNDNAKKHGFYSQPVKEFAGIEDVVADLLERQAQLSGFIGQQAAGGELDCGEMAKLLALLGQNASRIGRLLRDQRALSGAAADGLLDALGKALDELSTELGVKL